MSEKKYQIFVSSTYRDLIEAREKVIETILSLYHFPVAMEMFSADDDEQWEIIEETIRQSDYYILVIGHRYGSITREGISYTQKEFQLAKELKIPIISFVRDRNVPTTPEERDSDLELISKLDLFIQEVNVGRMNDFWKTTEELARKVAVALPKNMLRHPRTGWVRADQAVSPEMTAELLKLNTENRELRSEIEELKKQHENNPSLSVKFNNDNKLELKRGLVLYDPVKPVVYEEIDQDLLPYVSQDEIQEYNDSLPPAEELQKFNEDLELIKRIKEHHSDLSILVENVGKKRADDIYIDIEFPPSLMVVEKKEVEDCEYPVLEGVKVNPIKKAKSRQQNADMKKLGLGNAFEITGMLRNGLIPTLPQLADYSVLNPTIYDKNSYIGLKDNALEIEVNNILHTRNVEFEGEYVVVPLQKGQFEVKITIVCEQYTEKQIILVPVVIT